jgi:transposase
MARSLSVDLRRRVVGAIEGGFSCRAAAQRFGVSAASAIRWRAQERREGDIRPKLQGGDRHSQRIEAHAELILSALAAKSDITLSELREQLRARGVAVAIGTLWRFFKRRKITRKKDGARRRTAPQRRERGPREAWFEGQPTSIRRASSSSTRPPPTPRWRAFTVVRPGGERCRAAVPHGHWKTTTFTAGLRHDRIAAPMGLAAR